MKEWYAMINKETAAKQDERLTPSYQLFSDFEDGKEEYVEVAAKEGALDGTKKIDESTLKVIEPPNRVYETAKDGRTHCFFEVSKSTRCRERGGCRYRKWKTKTDGYDYEMKAGTGPFAAKVGANVSY